MKKRTLIFELFLVFLVAGLYIISILSDLVVISLPKFLILTYESQNDLLLTLFSVQASISTISIAVVSIITGITNETIYGVSVSKYITSIKPRIFKHKTLIIVSILGIFLNYIFVSYNLFNCALFSLLVSIVITVILVNNVSVIFKGRDYVKKEILQYIKHNYDEELIYNLNNETIDAIEAGSYLTLKRNYEAYKVTLELEIDKLSNQDTQVEELSIITQLSNSISDVFERIVKSKDSFKINDAVIFICDIYDIANKNPRTPFYLQIWNNISRTYFNGIKFLSYDQLREDGTCWRLRDKLYKNIETRTDEQLKKCDLRMYSSGLCYALCSKTDSFSSEEIKNIKKITYNNVYYGATHTHINKGINDVYLKELCYLHKYFIDQCDEQSINELYFEAISRGPNNDNSRVVYLVTLIYLYYLSYRESMLNGKDLQKCAQNILNKNHNTNKFFFYHMNILDITKTSYSYIQSLMCRWEYMDIKEAKWIIIDVVVLDFFVFTALNSVWKEDDLLQIMNILVPNGMFSIYSRYFPSENIEPIKANYQLFNEIFSDKLNEDSLNTNILLLKSVFDKKYKAEEIYDAENNPITTDMLGVFEECCLHTVAAYASSQFAAFAIKDDMSKENSLPICEKNNVTVFESVVPSLLFKKEEFSAYFVDSIQQYMGICFLNTIIPWTKYQKMSYKNRYKQQYLIDGITENKIAVDIVVGDKKKKWNEDNPDLLSDVISDASELRFPRMHNYYFILDGKHIEFAMSNFKVEFSDVDLDELSESCRRCETGRIEYNITNELFLPFDEVELKEYLHNTQRKVKITADIQYRVSQDFVGVGISIILD